MKRAASILFGCMAAAMALAQDLWITPQRFNFTIRDIASIRFLLGEHFTGNDWASKGDSIDHLVLYAPAGTENITQSAKGKNSLQLSLREEGTHMLAASSSNSRTSTDATNFHQYLQQEGLGDIIQYRLKHGEEKLDGTVYSQYNIKTIFQVGGMRTDRCLQPSIVALDIIPEENPYAVPEGRYSDKPVKKRFQVLFDGKPLNNALVKIRYRVAGNNARMDSARTNRKGWVSLDRHTGPNLLTCTYIERNRPDTGTHWQAYRASLSFEYSSFFSGKTAK
jgi:uncharacterized GH25 family protein